MPLLLMKDSWVEPLFQSTFHWEFNCSECNTTTKERVEKTLPTFTNIVPEWHPLHATHIAPCNTCNKKNQRRTMVLERVPPVFVLHFVEGLPDNDIKIYSFDFNGKRYSVSTVIQYKPQHKHFVTWVCNSDGLWLEFDDLKHPHCKTHQKLPVPAQEMHVVFWEVEEDGEPCACSPSSKCVNTPPTTNEIHPSLSEKDVLVDELMTCSPDQSLVTAHNDTDIFSALSACDDSAIMDTTVAAGVDASIGSTTLLDTFEGLSHNDIVTLTLVELKPDSETQLLNDSGGTQDLIDPNKNKMLDSTPDSSSAVIGSEMCQGSDVEIATIISSASDPESVDNSSSDPTFVPCARRAGGRGSAKGKAVIKPNEKKAPASKKAPQISPPTSSEQTNVICNEPARPDTQPNTPPFETPKATPPISSTRALPLPSHNNHTKSTVLDQNARWSFLLSKHPMNDLHKSITEVPSTHKPTPSHSSPNPVQRHQPRAFIHKPQLRTEENVGLPLKAAEMYVAFGTKSSDSQRSLPGPAPTTGHAKLMQPALPEHQKSLMNTPVLSGTSLCLTEVKGIPEISTLKKRSSQSSKVPSGLSQTEALRYKLIKKLKAKKKALAKLNKMLGQEVSLRPDSTNLSSPNTVTSSTYDGSTCEDFLSDLLSPATTASSLSPDSSGLQEILASGQAVLDQLDCGISAAIAESHTDASALEPSPENFLDEFLSQTVADRTTEMEREALSALEMFM